MASAGFFEMVGGLKVVLKASTAVGLRASFGNVSTCLLAQSQ